MDDQEGRSTIRRTFMKDAPIAPKRARFSSVKTGAGPVEYTKGLSSRRKGMRPKTAERLAFVDVDVTGRESDNREPLRCELDREAEDGVVQG
jgi:hypothetical protein